MVLTDVVGVGLRPLDVGWVTLLVELDALAVDDQVAALNLDITLELTVGGVVCKLCEIGFG